MQSTKLILITTLVMLIASFTALADNERALDDRHYQRYESAFEARGDQTAVMNAIAVTDMAKLCLNRQKLLEHNPLFSYRLKDAGVTNQKGSGRCWLFAGLNIFNADVMTQLKLSKFELSQPYLTFYDKMEKANLFLEEIIDMRDRPLHDRKMEIILDSPFGDGGWWHYVTDLIDKYGAVPLSAMPETKPSTSTGQINKLANRMLRGFASDLRTMHTEGATEDMIRQRKEEMMGDIYTLLVYNYGQPPEQFTFRYEDKDSTVSEPKSYTPKSFQNEFIGKKLPRYVTLMDNPCKLYDSLYQIESSRNMVEKPDMVMLNLPIERLKYYAKKALLDSQAVWFANDVGKDNYRDSAIMATDIYDYNSTYQLDFKISKAERIGYRDSYPTHAMVLMGLDTTSDGTIVKWLVENSWGTKKGDDGWWYMYDDWFDEYVYFVIVTEDMLDDEDRKKFKQTPIKEPVWDTFYHALRNLR
jgi:bleomycin hydrolase